MPWGWECRAKLIKQNPPNPTKRRPTKWDGFTLPGPMDYEQPDIFCGKGYSKIKRAPAYTFGQQIPVPTNKPAAKPNAPIFDISGMHRKGGPGHIPQGIIAEKCQPPGSKLNVPGPGAYTPKPQKKNPPAFTMRIAAKPPYEPWDMWTPSPNMYHPPIMRMKKEPMYSFRCAAKPRPPDDLPGPGEHDPNFEYIQRAKPAYTFGILPKKPPLPVTPAPNAYCEKKYKYNQQRPPAPSFGIRHSPYIGKMPVYEKPSNVALFGRKE